MSKYIRDDLKRLGLVLATRWHAVPGLDTDSALARRIEDLNNAIEALSSRGSRPGNFDFVAGALQRSSEDSARTTASLIAPSAIFVDSHDALGVLEVRSKYAVKNGDAEPALLAYTLAADHRPHTDMIKNLPLCTFYHPSYRAPLEDLLDHLAVDLYAARRSGDAEDGAVGWLLRSVIDRNQIESHTNFLSCLAEYLEHWTTQRLSECLQVWDHTVGPALGRRK